MPIFGFVIALFAVISVIASSARNTNAARNNTAAGVQAQRNRERLEQLNQLRLERARQQVAYRQGTQRPAAQPEKPIYAHSTEDCTGGSIHDGYHEGSFRAPQAAASTEGTQGQQGARRGSYAPGRTGQGMAGSEGSPVQRPQAQEAAQPAVREAQINGSDRLANAIASQPAIVQGMIWAEVLGRPLSD